MKLKEICNLHAEAYSGAEFQHGPIALVTSGYPILIFMPGDESAELLSALAADLCRKKAPFSPRATTICRARRGCRSSGKIVRKPMRFA